MASFKDQARAASDPKLVLPITGGSSSEPANKKQKKESQRRVQHVGVQGPFIKSRWSHIPITFSQEDLQLKDYPHNDAMVIFCVIKGFLVHNVLVDTGSAADIIFAKAFRQMQEPEDKIHDATHPLEKRSSTAKGATVGPMLRRRRSYRKKRSSAEAVCIRWPKVPIREASVLQTDLKIE
jgi:hypothetical protein